VLVLDEATSALDGESAEAVRRNAVELIEESRVDSGRGDGGRVGGGRGPGRGRAVGRTVLIITHMKEMMQCAENVAALNKGKVVEEGTYEELLRWEGGAL
jgi:ATP-binding cassette, subfamily B (MDR/TAP), member 1